MRLLLASLLFATAVHAEPLPLITLKQVGSDGDTPVVRIEKNPRIDAIVAQPALQRMLRIDRAAARIGGDATAKTYLLLSEEEGGFARRGFVLESTDGKRTMMKDAMFVDLVVDEASLDSGEFEEIFAHELGHVILRRVVGDLPAGMSRRMHLADVATDRITAFDEGFAEAWQPLIRDWTRNENLRARDRGQQRPNLNRLWLSALDRERRVSGIRQNAFAFEKDGSLRTGAQMLATEGFVGTLVYRLLTDEALQKGSGIETSSTKFLRALAATKNAPSILGVADSWRKLYPEDEKALLEITIGTSYAAFTSHAVWKQLDALATAGAAGDPAYIESLGEARKAIAALIASAERRDVKLDAAVDPELWLASDRVLVKEAPWSSEAKMPLVLDVNTANADELRQIGISTADKVVAQRRERGGFASFEELKRIVGDEEYATIVALEKKAEELGPLGRK